MVTNKSIISIFLTVGSLIFRERKKGEKKKKKNKNKNKKQKGRKTKQRFCRLQPPVNPGCSFTSVSPHSATHLPPVDEYIAWLLFCMCEERTLTVQYFNIVPPPLYMVMLPCVNFLYYNTHPPLWMCHDTGASDLPFLLFAP